MIALLTVILFAMVAINVPIAVTLGIIGTVGHLANTGELGLYDMPLKLFEGATNFPLIAIPLFVLAGALMNTTGISARLIELAMALIGFVRGGLAMVNVAVSMFFAEISGSAVADVAATGSVMIPAMKKRGYSPAFAAAVTSSSASLAIIIPPSIPMILYAAFADVSVVQLFVAGIVPGVLGGFAMLCVCWLVARRYNLPREAAFDLVNLGRKFWAAKYALMLPVIILGGIFGGLVTATEGAGLAVLAAAVIGFGIHRDLDIRRFHKALIEGVMQTGAVMLLVSTSAVLGLFLTQSQAPQQFAAWAVAAVENKYLVLALLNGLLLLLGVFLHGAAAIVLVVPIVLPLALAVGVDPLHFGLIVTLNLAIGQQTPPVASVLATSCSIAKVDMARATRANWPFIGILLGALLLVTYAPTVPLFLVEYFYR